MKQLIRKACAAATFLLLAGKIALASHGQGGEISYVCLAPNTYQVTVKAYTDCTGASAATSQSVTILSPGCNTGRSFSLSQTGQTYGDPYCSAIGNVCNTTRQNHRETTYSGTVTFTPAEAACSDWIFYNIMNARPALGNLVNSQGDLYLEANLKLSAGNSSAVINPTAPQVEMVCYLKDTKVSLGATDPDCDSLSYELVTPMSHRGVPYSYAPLQVSSTNFFVNPNPPAPYCNTCTPSNPQLGMYQNMPTSYSPTFPFLSVNANWNAINPATGFPYQTVAVTPYFNLNAATGELNFRPAVYHNTPPIQGNNKYVVVIKISEWRKVNGAIVKVGTVLRDMIFMVEDCGSNINPEVTSITANGQQIQPGSLITVRPGAPLNIQLSSSDQPGDSLTFDTDATTVLAGATFNQTAAAFPKGTVSWVAPAGNPTCGVRYFYVRVRDNFCPIRGKKVYTIGVRVSNAGTATGITKEAANNLHFTAYPNPYSDRVNFRFAGSAKAGRSEIVIYNGLGQEISRLNVPAGATEAEWSQAGQFPAGTYLARLLIDNEATKTLKFMRLR